jgi:hypothetical protein
MSKDLLEEYRKVYESVTMDKNAYDVMRQRMNEGKKERIKMKNRKLYRNLGAAAAAALVILALPNTSGTVAYAMGNIPVLGNFFKVITIRDYQYEDQKQMADVEVPEITVVTDTDDDVREETQKSVDEVNAEIKRITEQYVREFQEQMEQDGYRDVVVKSEQVKTGEDYFTLKLMCYEGAADGVETDYYYTINTSTGERMQLSDLFRDGCDYQRVISDNIKAQMREQMADDENMIYWLDDEDPDMNFTGIDANPSFYINENDEIVICFQEGDVAPMYMGNVEFIIPGEAVEGMRK